MDYFIGNHICGLHYTANWKRIYLPQVKLDSHTTINPVCFTTQLTQTFRNPNAEAISQVRYTFPLYDGVAVSGYTISYGSKTLKGIVKQKDVAKKTYQAAVDRGESAGLLESLPAGVFGVTLGNVPSKTDIVVSITYCGELKHDAAIDGLRYTLPTSIAPRYGSYPGEVLDSNTVAKGCISITVDVDMADSAIRKVQSPSHPIAVSMGAMSTAETSNQAPFQPSQASATLTLGKAELAEDFVLQLLIDDISKPQAILENHPTLPNQRAIMATLVPKFTLEPSQPEIIFIADQSGSMGGSKNQALVSALNVFLKSLPLGVRFNICAFGSTFKFLWPKSQAYNEHNLKNALSFVNGFTASYGGTQILEPVTAAFKQRLSDLPLEVMLLTDGEIWEEDALFKYVNEQVHGKGADARVFALGIGGDVSHTLVEGVARAGHGFAQFVTQNEETDQKVVRMLKGALYAHTKDYELEVHYDEKDKTKMDDDDEFEIIEKVTDCLKIDEEKGGPPPVYDAATQAPKSFFDSSADTDKAIKTGDETADRYAHLPSIPTPKIVQAPNAIPPLFPFNRTTVYLLLGPDSVQKNVTSVTLRARSAQGPLELNIPVHSSAVGNAATVHQLAARKAVQDLEEGRGWIQAAHTAAGVSVKAKYESRFDEIMERECVRLGERFQVASKWTSFVAVEEKSGKPRKQMRSDLPPEAVHIQEGGMMEAYKMEMASAASMPLADEDELDDSYEYKSMARFTSAGSPQDRDRSMPRKKRMGGSGLFGGAGGGVFGTRSVASSRSATNSAGGLFGSPGSSLRGAPQAVNLSAAPPPPAPSGFAAAPKSSAFGAPSGGARGPALSMAFAQSQSQSAAPKLKKGAFSFSSTRARVATESSGVDMVHALINLQTFCGAWSWSTELFSILGVEMVSVDQSELGGKQEVCATLLAVAYLETKMVSRRDVWEMVVAKARGWLAGELGTDGKVVDGMVVKAAAYF